MATISAPFRARSGSVVANVNANVNVRRPTPMQRGLMFGRPMLMYESWLDGGAAPAPFNPVPPAASAWGR